MIHNGDRLRCTAVVRVDDLADGDDKVFIRFCQRINGCRERDRCAKLSRWNHDDQRTGEIVTTIGGDIAVAQGDGHRLIAGHG